jgi:transcriptional regulator with XRE-family HTH domain
MAMRRKSVDPRVERFCVALGQRIRSLRTERGINQDDFAEMVGIQRAHVGLIENAKVEARVGTLLLIALALEIEVTELVRLEG